MKNKVRDQMADSHKINAVTKNIKMNKIMQINFQVSVTSYSQSLLWDL